MSDNLTKIRVFVASPGDVMEEREQVGAAIAELNTTVCKDRGLLLELVKWESHTHPDMGRIQGIINSQIGPYDIFVGIMWKRFGSPSGVATSGTEEEFRIALKAREEGESLPILFYFCQAPFAPPRTEEDIEQLAGVMRFRDELSAKGLVWDYTDRDRFADIIRPHLAKVIIDHYRDPRTADFEDESYIPIAERLHTVLEISKERSASRDLPYTTADLLLALFGTENAFASRCFDRVRNGLASQLRASLSSYVEDILPAHSTDKHFRQFEWVAREEVRQAQRYALHERSPVVTEKHLLLSILETSSSNTVQQLRHHLGQEFSRVLAVVKDTPLTVPIESTPGKVFA